MKHGCAAAPYPPLPPPGGVAAWIMAARLRGHEFAAARCEFVAAWAYGCVAAWRYGCVAARCDDVAARLRNMNNLQ